MRAWQAALASFLFFAPSVTNAETIQISDDRGGLVIAYQMHWAMLAPENVMYELRVPVFRHAQFCLAIFRVGKMCVGSRASLGIHLATPDSSHKICGEPIHWTSLVDCTAGRFNPSNYLATSARYLRIFS